MQETFKTYDPFPLSQREIDRRTAITGTVYVPRYKWQEQKGK